MLIVSTSTEALQDQLVELGAVAYIDVPKWEPSLDLIAALIGAEPAVVHFSLGTDCDVSDVRTRWFERIRPFESNLRAGKRAPRRQLPVLSPPNAKWSEQAELLISRLSFALGAKVHRIDHIGSTAVSGLPAKDLIDIQVVVDDLTTASEMARRAGFVHVAGDWYGKDRHGTMYREEVAVDADPGRSVNVNFRSRSDPVWKETLLFRDFLRAYSTERDRYAEIKQSLVSQHVNVDRYGELKMPYIRAALERAESERL